MIVKAFIVKDFIFYNVCGKPNSLLLQVDAIMIHPEYDSDTVDNDVALLLLPVTLTPSASRGIACLPTPRQPLPTKQRCTIIGWGKSRPNDDFGTDILHEAEVSARKNL